MIGCQPLGWRCCLVYRLNPHTDLFILKFTLHIHILFCAMHAETGVYDKSIADEMWNAHNARHCLALAGWSQVGHQSTRHSPWASLHVQPQHTRRQCMYAVALGNISGLILTKHISDGIWKPPPPYQWPINLSFASWSTLGWSMWHRNAKRKLSWVAIQRKPENKVGRAVIQRKQGSSTIPKSFPFTPHIWQCCEFVTF